MTLQNTKQSKLSTTEIISPDNEDIDLSDIDDVKSMNIITLPHALKYMKKNHRRAARDYLNFTEVIRSTVFQGLVAGFSMKDKEREVENAIKIMKLPMVRMEHVDTPMEHRDAKLQNITTIFDQIREHFNKVGDITIDPPALEYNLFGHSLFSLYNIRLTKLLCIYESYDEFLAGKLPFCFVDLSNDELVKTMDLNLILAKNGGMLTLNIFKTKVPRAFRNEYAKGVVNSGKKTIERIVPKEATKEQLTNLNKQVKNFGEQIIISSITGKQRCVPAMFRCDEEIMAMTEYIMGMSDITDESIDSIYTSYIQELVNKSVLSIEDMPKVTKPEDKYSEIDNEAISTYAEALSRAKKEQDESQKSKQ